MAVERTFASSGGFPYTTVRTRPRLVRRVVATLIAVAAMLAGVASTAASLGGYADAGVEPQGEGAVIDAVSPTGFAWRDGIRSGQVIVHLADALSPGGWSLETLVGSRRVVARAAPVDEGLRLVLPLGVAAMVCGGFAIVFLRGHRSWVTAAASAGLLLSSPGLLLYGKPESSTLVLGAAAVVPALWVAWRPRVSVLVSILASTAVMAFVVVWALTRLQALPAYDTLERVRDSMAFWGMTVVIIGSVVAPVVRKDPVNFSRPRIGDIIMVGAVGGIALAGVAVFAIPLGAIAALMVAGILILPTWRRVIGIRVERLLLADVREHAALEAAEAERAHLSRELHDVPLQQLAGVIRRLELIPAARVESEHLRDVAEQLRGVATELRPPVLDDLGLAAAIEFLVEKDATPETGITADITNEAGLDPGSRPPAEVELALFRIVQEAIGNSLRHAHASTIALRGVVSPSRCEIEVLDNGRGLVDSEARAAARRGRLGLASIRRRAEAIDADVSIERVEVGTRVWVRWIA